MCVVSECTNTRRRLCLRLNWRKQMEQFRLCVNWVGGQSCRFIMRGEGVCKCACGAGKTTPSIDFPVFVLLRWWNKGLGVLSTWDSLILRCWRSFLWSDICTVWCILAWIWLNPVSPALISLRTHNGSGQDEEMAYKSQIPRSIHLNK